MTSRSGGRTDAPLVGILGDWSVRAAKSKNGTVSCGFVRWLFRGLLAVDLCADDGYVVCGRRKCIGRIWDWRRRRGVDEEREGSKELDTTQVIGCGEGGCWNPYNGTHVM